ncbi:MAG: class II aldolase/adducin family protein [Holophagales bacterium]|nr:class II aldolase/adducin family protein [Holophagales bacterium]
MDHAAVRAGLVACGRRLDALGFAPATDGNISARLGPHALLVTPAGREKGGLSPEELLLVDPDGTGRRESGPSVDGDADAPPLLPAARGRRRRRPRAPAGRHRFRRGRGAARRSGHARDRPHGRRDPARPLRHAGNRGARPGARAVGRRTRRLPPREPRRPHARPGREGGAAPDGARRAPREGHARRAPPRRTAPPDRHAGRVSPRRCRPVRTGFEVSPAFATLPW